MRQSIKSRLAAGDKLVGLVSLLPSPDVAEIIAGSGIDLTMIDHEHGLGGLDDFVAIDRAVRGSALQTMVRLPGRDFHYARRLLDVGATALVCPCVDTVEQAEAFVSACRYPPHGTRGAGSGLRAAGWGADAGYYAAAEDALLVVAQIESAEAVENIEAICAVPGIDMLLIGPRDLSASIGALNQFDNPRLWELVGRAETAIRASGKHLASTLFPGKTAQQMFADGYGLVLSGKDVDFVLNGAKALAAAARG